MNPGSGGREATKGGKDAPTLEEVVQMVKDDLMRVGFGKRVIEVTAQDHRLLNARVISEDSYKLKS